VSSSQAHDIVWLLKMLEITLAIGVIAILVLLFLMLVGGGR
jgi:hypothetical protein